MKGAEKLFAEFAPVSTAEWDAAVAKDLKGRDPKTLVWRTEDGIEVKPYYRSEDTRGLHTLEPAAAGRAWHIGCEARNVEALNTAFERGVQAVVIPLSLLSEIPAGQVSVHVKATVAEAVSCGHSHSGSFDLDPVADFTADQAAEHFKDARRRTPGMAPFVVDGRRFHNAAATATQELAFAMATAAECLAELTERGIPAQEAAPNIIFSFGIGSNYFFEIAKLRAARVLWGRLVAAFDENATTEIRIHAHTSRWNKTVYDAEVNLLRATTEAMSAVIGGCEMLNVGTFDRVWKEPNAFSERLAINTQLILREEAHFARTADPASGSWYIESLTDKIARAAWKLFQEIESAGGMRKALGEGLVEALIGATRLRREAAIAHRKQAFIGVNQYPNFAEQAPEELVKSNDPLPNTRGPYAFEAMRLATDRHAAKTGGRPVVFLARIGDPKMRRARAEFVANYFACAGFAISDSPGYETAEQAISAVKKANPDVVVLCSSDAEYADLADAFCKRIQQPVIIAGYPKDMVDALLGAGVADFVYLGSNAVEVLTRWQKRLGVVS